MKLQTCLCLVVLTAATACTKKTGPTVPSPTAREAYGMSRNDFAILVDVREKDEIAEGIAAGAKWMPTSSIEANDGQWRQFVKDLPRDKQIIFYCKAGLRAKKAAEKAAALGFKAASIGGYEDWVTAGLPVTKPQH